LKHMVEEDRGFVGVNLHSNKGWEKFQDYVKEFSS
jgi:hypothetical protein